MNGFLIQPPTANPTADDRREKLRRAFAAQIMGQQPQNVTQGLGQLMAGIGMGIGNYNRQGQAFPTAPAGGAPSFGTTLGNFFTGRNNGGLY
jgi:hypothetical protein